LTGQTSKRVASLNGNLYVPGQTAIDVGARKLLVKSELINIIVDENGVSITLLEGQNKQSHQISTLENSYRVIDLLSSEPCYLKIKIEGMRDMFFPIDAPIDGGDTRFFKALLPVLEAATQLRLRANAPDTPVHIENVVQQRFEIMEANRAFFEQDFLFSFETELPRPEVTLAPADFLFTVPFAIDSSYYAYALRARVDPTNKTDRVTWLASQVTPLVIQLLNGDLQQEYERFKEKTIAISGIKNIVSRALNISREGQCFA
jgi:hypothetical protein